MALDLTNAAGALKRWYLPGVRSQINNKCLLLEQVESGDEHVEGEEWVLSLHVQRNAGVGARGESGTSPAAGNQKYVTARDTVKEIRGRIEITGRIIKAMASNRGSFVRAIDSEMKGVTKDAYRDMNRQLAGTGDGVIATCGVTSGSTTVNLAATTPKSALRQLEVGKRIDIGTVANPVSVASNREITAVDTTNKTITISGAAVTTAGTNFVFNQGAGGNNPQLETHGLQEIVKDTGTLFNVNPSTYAVWKSYVKDAASGPISDPLLEEVMDEIDLRAGEEIDLWLVSYGVYREYGNYLSTLKRAPNTVDLKGGHKALSILSGSREAGLTRERDIPDGMAFALNTKHLFAPTMSDWDFMDEDGAVFSRVADKHSYEATLYKFMDFATDQRNAHGLIKNIAE
jgi:hypothetical protein